MTPLTVTINGSVHGPREVRDDLTMNDFLREYLGMTGTKFGCGAAQCLSCAIIVDEADGTSYTSPTCIVPAANFDGKSIRTVEGHAKGGELTTLQNSSAALHQNLRLEVVGHSDATGAEGTNQSLSQRRADRIAWELIQLGIPDDVLHARGVASAEPVRTEDTEENRQFNRSVKFVVGVSASPSRHP